MEFVNRTINMRKVIINERRVKSYIIYRRQAAVRRRGGSSGRDTRTRGTATNKTSPITILLCTRDTIDLIAQTHRTLRARGTHFAHTHKRLHHMYVCTCLLPPRRRRRHQPAQQRTVICSIHVTCWNMLFICVLSHNIAIAARVFTK